MYLDWQDYASCKGMGDEFINTFFDDYEQDPGSRDAVHQMCQACPVNDVCLEFGKATDSTGVWGGKYLVRGREKEL